jgi:hypothetical protein
LIIYPLCKLLCPLCRLICSLCSFYLEKKILIIPNLSICSWNGFESNSLVNTSASWSSLLTNGSFNLFGLIFFLYKMTIHFDIFYSLVKHRVGCNVTRDLIVTIHLHWFLNFYPEIRKESLDPCQLACR